MLGQKYVHTNAKGKQVHAYLRVHTANHTQSFILFQISFLPEVLQRRIIADVLRPWPQVAPTQRLAWLCRAAAPMVGTLDQAKPVKQREATQIATTEEQKTKPGKEKLSKKQSRASQSASMHKKQKVKQAMHAKASQSEAKRSKPNKSPGRSNRPYPTTSEQVILRTSVPVEQAN